MKRFAFLLAAPLVPLLHARVERELGPFRAQERVMYLRSGEHVKRLVPGFEMLMADIYWLRTVQYFGSQRVFSTEKEYALLGPLIDITTDLDPRFELAYRYGAVFLSEEWPQGAGKPEQGVALLERGVAALPHSWRLRWDLGSAWFYFMKDPRKASEVLIEASKLPGAPFWLENLAAKFLEGDDRASARAIWERQYETTQGAMRENALFHIQSIDALEGRDIVRRMVERFQKERGRLPERLEELVEAGYARAVPTDPAGVRYAYEPGSGKVSVDRSSRLWRSKYQYE